jgi:hypothetical protein
MIPTPDDYFFAISMLMEICIKHHEENRLSELPEEVVEWYMSHHNRQLDYAKQHGGVH